MVADPGGFDPDPTSQKKPELDQIRPSRITGSGSHPRKTLHPREKERGNTRGGRQEDFRDRHFFNLIVGLIALFTQ